jgi:hypothetical protein
MTDLTALVRSELTELADASQPSADLADRAVTAGIRRRLWRRAATAAAGAAAVLAVTLAATQVFAPQAPQPRPAAADPRNAVYATDRNGLTARVLDPTTGAYRTIGVDVISAPATDLRHAAVTPPRVSDGRGNPIDFPPNRVGRYDATTGDIRWYDVPLGVGVPAISPDGRYIAAPDYAPATRIVLVDTQSGAVQVLSPGAETLAAAGVQYP